MDAWNAPGRYVFSDSKKDTTKLLVWNYMLYLSFIFVYWSSFAGRWKFLTLPPIGHVTSSDTHVSVELTHMKLLTAEVILHPPYTNLLMMAYYILVAVLSSFHRRFILRFTEQYDKGIALWVLLECVRIAVMRSKRRPGSSFTATKIMR